MNSLYKHCLFLFVVIFSIACNNSVKSNADKQNKDAAVKSVTKKDSSKTILFFGNSLTAGYGLDNPEDAFPALIQTKIDALNLPYKVVNAGLSGETSAGGNERIDWLLKNPVDVFVLELGANDGLRGVDPSTTYKNLRNIVKKVSDKYPSCKLVLAGMLVPPNVGTQYFEEFKAIYPALAKEQNMHLIPFLLADVAGVQQLNQSDGIHPTKEGQIKVAENVWQTIKPLLQP
ncbi:arylesterase [Sphingobacterium deserti]|uniref:G-D-S-L family lipolytic protein n=1 Tax=Sphingobacterium deserti TaxID=1229276 RepID=A0A0B8T6P2_9SPHI|nr:arylesterase [Sphingobacterium deserti]KGE13040.1 G-D-S-L family lipolytic protein [Sphingobacterium deserti]